MLRLFARLYLRLLLAVVALIAILVLALNGLTERESERNAREVARGQIYQLQQALNPLPRQNRPAALARLQPHFGLRLSLHSAGALSLAPAELQKLAAGDFVIPRQIAQHDEDVVFVAPLSHQQWLRIAAPTSSPVLGWINLGANAALLLVTAVLLWLWARRHWRELAHVKDTVRLMGQGQLSARVELAQKSDLYELAQHINQMATRIELLLSQQTEMIHGVAHELRTPMARMAFELSLIGDARDAGERADRLAGLQDDLHELDTLITEMLTYCRLQQHDLLIEREAINAADWLADVLASSAADAARHNIHLIATDVDAGRCRIEARLMARAAHNVLRNALAHAEQRVHIELHHTHGQWTLLIDDDGPGIAVAERERVFEPFTRLDPSRNRSSGGFGLGLAIVRRIVQWHGGDVQILQAPLGGARVALSWPDTPVPSMTPN
ncbi:ATP-binding protein [Chitinibacteraceae bacterium HSL-7]